jgi:hypothetical protein
MDDDYRSLMDSLRPAPIHTLGGAEIGDELSGLDPDLDDVPDERRALDGREVRHGGRDVARDRLVLADAVLVVSPALFARARRASDGDAA